MPRTDKENKASQEGRYSARFVIEEGDRELWREIPHGNMAVVLRNDIDQVFEVKNLNRIDVIQKGKSVHEVQFNPPTSGIGQILFAQVIFMMKNQQKPFINKIIAYDHSSLIKGMVLGQGPSLNVPGEKWTMKEDFYSARTEYEPHYDMTSDMAAPDDVERYGPYAGMRKIEHPPAEFQARLKDPKGKPFIVLEVESPFDDSFFHKSPRGNLKSFNGIVKFGFGRNFSESLGIPKNMEHLAAIKVSLVQVCRDHNIEIANTIVPIYGKEGEVSAMFTDLPNLIGEFKLFYDIVLNVGPSGIVGRQLVAETTIRIGKEGLKSCYPPAQKIVENPFHKVENGLLTNSHEGLNFDSSRTFHLQPNYLTMFETLRRDKMYFRLITRRANTLFRIANHRDVIFKFYAFDNKNWKWKEVGEVKKSYKNIIASESSDLEVDASSVPNNSVFSVQAIVVDQKRMSYETKRKTIGEFGPFYKV